MTDHFAEAEHLLSQNHDFDTLDNLRLASLMRAQIHATLAMAQQLKRLQLNQGVGR